MLLPDISKIQGENLPQRRRAASWRAAMISLILGRAYYFISTNRPLSVINPCVIQFSCLEKQYLPKQKSLTKKRIRVRKKWIKTEQPKFDSFHICQLSGLSSPATIQSPWKHFLSAASRTCVNTCPLLLSCTHCRSSDCFWYIPALTQYGSSRKELCS